MIKNLKTIHEYNPNIKSRIISLIVFVLLFIISYTNHDRMIDFSLFLYSTIIVTMIILFVFGITNTRGIRLQISKDDKVIIYRETGLWNEKNATREFVFEKDDIKKILLVRIVNRQTDDFHISIVTISNETIQIIPSTSDFGRILNIFDELKLIFSADCEFSTTNQMGL